MTAEAIVRALGGHRAGATWMARCPAHEDRRPSLSISAGKDGKVLVRCHAGCDQRNLIAALQKRGLWPATARLSGIAPGRRRRIAEEPDAGEMKRSAAALAIWEASHPAERTPVATYLCSRGLDLPASPGLRFHAGLKHPSGGVWPAMVALVTHGLTGSSIAVHRTFLKPELQTDDKKKRDKLKKEIFRKEGYKDPYGRFGRGTPFKAPPAGYGDYAFILHILASLTDQGRSGIVCPQGVLFRGQPEVEEETGEFEADGNPVIKRRKADDEHLIRKALLQSRLIDAVISLPLNVFYGATVPACLLILRKRRPPERHDKVLLVYAARHYRELSNQNELPPQDVMRILVHVQAFGDAIKVPDLVARHSGRIREQINAREHDEVERVEAEYADVAARLAKLETEVAEKRAELENLTAKTARGKAEAALAKLESQRDKAAAKIAERDEKIAESRRRAEDDRRDVDAVSKELGALYGDPNELLKHARAVDLAEIEENEFNLNIPRYVDTFEPEPRVPVKDALKALGDTQKGLAEAEEKLSKLLKAVGYGE